MTGADQTVDEIESSVAKLSESDTDAGVTATNEAQTSPEALLSFLASHAFSCGPGGVEWIYRLASPRMRSKVGDLAVFQRAFSNALYAPLITHGPASIVGMTTIGEAARAEVVIETDGEVVTYLVGLKLSRHGQSAGKWQLTGVARDGVDL